MKVSRITKNVITLVLIGILAATAISPSLSTISNSTCDSVHLTNISISKRSSSIELEWEKEKTDESKLIYTEENWINSYRETPDASLDMANDQNDAGYNTDAGDKITRSFPIYPGEIADGAPGRGRSGTLDPDDRDSEDWYLFSVCEGQTIQVSLSTTQDYDYEILDTAGQPQGKDYTATETGRHFLHIFATEGAGTGDYTLTLTFSGQNDAGSNGDAGDTSSTALSITPGTYSGYMDMNDPEDWYSFSVNTGQGIFINLEAPYKSDIDIHLYNPTGDMVHEALYYGDDQLEYPADASGTWKIQLDMFPGWDSTKWPDNYYLYGSGGYELELTIGGTATPPVTPESQPDITPVAQTFIINDDPASSKDEYGYLAAIPAANYMMNDNRYVSPIVYQGVDYIPTWFTSVDQTTQYLIDDWDTYLKRHDLNATTYTLQSEPIQSAADIALSQWSSSSEAVVAIDGSSFTDSIENVVDTDTTLVSLPSTTSIQATDLMDIGGTFAKPIFIGKKWGAIHVVGKGDTFGGDTGLITPRYESAMEDWWPYPYDENGEDTDTFYPVTIPGMWFPYVTDTAGLNELQIVQYEGDRYTIPIDNGDSSIEVTLSTNEPSNLVVFLVDPNGNIRRPQVPHHNGGEINPIHVWNGGHWENDQDEFRFWIIDPHTEYTVDAHNAMPGKWTAVVVPFLDYKSGSTSFNGQYHITINIRKYNPDRLAAGLSAANGAVVASLKHVPLLYVTKESVPPETANALSQLGVTKIIFVNIDGVSSASLSGSITEYTSLQAVIDAIKENAHSENFITLMSFGTGEGYFAPAAMIAAYHGSPVLDIGEANEAYNTLDAIAAWREYAGDYYHGARSVGHLPQMDAPFDLVEFIKGVFEGEFPHPGFDLKLRWFSTVSEGIHDLAAGYGLDSEGKEAYQFVGPRDTDIRSPAVRAMVGNNSYAGHIPVETAAFSSAVICRDILYPALIYANPGRDVTTSQMMNYPDGYSWKANDGNDYNNYASQEVKQSFSSRGRFFEGHTIWDNLLERYNSGVSISYYSGHGTGGSGISAQYPNVADTFPLAELTHEHLIDFDWWDSWRGYSGYDGEQTKTCRWGGESGYNSQEPNLYDIIHFKWVDQLLDNLHSELEFWSSCTTGEHLGPIVYLSHGSSIWFGAAGSTYGIQDDLHNNWIFHDVLAEGKGLGESQSEYQWLFNRDFTTLDPATLYGRSTLFQLAQGGLTNVKVLYGDPTMTCYAPDWIEPLPVIP